MKNSTFLPRLFFVISLCATAQEIPEVDQDRLEDTIYALAQHGMMENGETNRVAYSDADLQGRAYIISLMQVSDLDVSVDYAGNIIGKRAGKNPDLKPIGFGSHIDMVPNGGNYDGCVGSLAAIEVVRTLNEAGLQTEHPLEIFIFADEEGGTVGSKAIAGDLKEEAMEKVNSTGYSMREGINRLGGNASRIDEVERPEGSLSAFVELHIEQGGMLDREQIDIGIVEGIVGIRWWDVNVKGIANHAGTTPMNMRNDALVAASKLVIAVNEEALQMVGNQVGTVGMISALPGAPNVIPGEVRMSLEIRDLSSDKIQRLFKAIEGRAKAIESAMGVKFTFEPVDNILTPALTEPKIQNLIREAAEELGLRFKKMQSGAGHDAQEMARIAPIGMIFVPSQNGISHSPREYTSPGDMANGANVLLRTILKLDQSP